MMNIETWKITPAGLSGIHLGKQGMAQERSSVILHSDSLFSALVLTLAFTYSDAVVKQELSEFLDGKPPFVITSAFPYAGDVRFFPLPLNTDIDISSAKTPDQLSKKELKKVSFVSDEVFRQLLSGKTELLKLMKKENLLNGGLLVTDAEKNQLPYKIRVKELNVFDNHEKHPRVAIGRTENASSLYFTGAVHYAPGCGMWFGVQWLQAEASWRSTLPALLANLQDEGIGGERSSGYGQVKIASWETLQLPGSQGQDWVTLSRYLPAAEEMSSLSHSRARYAIDSVGGWLRSPGIGSQRRRSINMLREGSVFGPLDRPPTGKIVDVQPVYGDVKFDHHPVYRSGLTLAVGFAKENSR